MNDAGGEEEDLSKFLGRGKMADQSYALVPRGDASAVLTNKARPSPHHAGGGEEDEGKDDDDTDSLQDLEPQTRRPVKRRDPIAEAERFDLEQKQKHGHELTSADGDGKAESIETASTKLDRQRRVIGVSTSLQPSRSYGDGHGYTCFGKEEVEEGGSLARDKDEEVGSGQQSEEEEKRFIVQWDGDGDPANPRNMSTAKKWTVTFIVSSGSMCV